MIKNKINNKIYFGQTVNSFNRRYSNSDLCLKTHNEHLNNAINKYGIKNFQIDKEFDVAYSKEELDDLEDMYIKIYNTINSDFGYNKKLGGGNGRPTEETLKKLSESHIGINVGAEHPRAKKVVLINTGEVFETMTQASDKYNLSTSKISSCCSKKRYSCGTTTNGMKMVWRYYDEYIHMTKEEIDFIINYATLKNKHNGIYNPTSKKVVCLTTLEIFECMKHACDKYNLSAGSLSSACNGKYTYHGKDVNGNRLVWRYYDEYILLSKEEIDELINKAYTTKNKTNKVKIICITTNEVFDSIKEAQEKYGCKNISAACSGKIKHCGVLKDGTKLKWMHYTTYLKNKNNEVA